MSSSLNKPHSYKSVARQYFLWSFLKSSLHRGWWLVASLYLVVDAGLSPLQLVALGTAQGITVILAEVPAGLVADTWSRKWSMVIAHVLMGLGMLSTGFVTSFPLLVLTQMLWGLGNTFLSGADVAYLSDELDDPEQVGGALTTAAVFGQVGAAFGIILLGALGWMISLSFAVIVAGSLTVLLGVYIASVFTEERYQPSKADGSMAATLRMGVEVVRTDRVVMTILASTLLINGADEVFGRLFAKHLIELGLPQSSDPIVWITLLGLVTLSLGALTLRFIERFMNDHLVLYPYYILGMVLGGLGIVLFAIAPSPVIAMAGVIVVHGIAWNVVRVVGVIWLNTRATASIRATLQSFMSQAENLGEVTLGFTLGIFAQVAGIAEANLMAALCVFLTAGWVWRRHRAQ